MAEQGPQYADSEGRRMHRIAALVATPLLAALLIWGMGPLRGVRLAATLIFPFAAIWFADELADHVSQASGGWISPLQAPTVLRVAGWFCFGGLCVLSLLAALSR